MSIEPIRRGTFREHIARSLRSMILSGAFTPGSPVVEARLAEQFGVSRGPLREAIRELIDEGLLVAVPYTGTHVVDLSIEDIGEIFTIRTELESFAFREIWPRRDQVFRREMVSRHQALLRCVDAGDEQGGIMAELALHSWVYEATGHRILLGIWKGLRGRLQLYWAAHHLAHGRQGPKRDGHESYVRFATGDDLTAMLGEVRRHMGMGYAQTERFLLDRLAAPRPSTGSAKAVPEPAKRRSRTRSAKLALHEQVNSRKELEA